MSQSLLLSPSPIRIKYKSRIEYFQWRIIYFVELKSYKTASLKIIKKQYISFFIGPLNNTNLP